MHLASALPNRLIHFISDPLFILSALLLVLIFTGSLAGCASTAPGYGEYDPALPYTRIMISGDDLTRALKFDEPVVEKNDDGFIRQVQITVRAASATPLRVDYRPIFKDVNGMVLEPQASWTQVDLEMRVPERIVMKPMGLNARDYEIQFRWAR